MKIGIITFHRPINYGAILQAVALPQKITTMGGKAEIIDYRNDFQDDWCRFCDQQPRFV